MILTPTPLHQGGMWCAEEYPCKNHGAWKQNEPQQDYTKKYAEFRNYLLLRFNEYETPISMSAEQVRDLINKFYEEYLKEETYE